MAAKDNREAGEVFREFSWTLAGLIAAQPDGKRPLRRPRSGKARGRR